MSPASLLVAVVLSAAPPEAAPSQPLPRNLQITLERVVQAYYAGDSAGVWTALSPAVVRLSEVQIERLDQALAAQEVPGVGELLVGVRMNLVQQNLGHALPEPQMKERMLVLSALRDRVQAIVAEQTAHPLVSGEGDLPQSLVEFERTLWDVHVLRNKLLTASRATEYAQALAAGVTERQRVRLSEDEQSLLSDASAALPDIQSAAEVLDELDAELRLERLDRGLAALKEPELTEERFLAAWSTLQDAEVLTAFLKDQQAGTGPRRLRREKLRQPGLAEEIQAKAEQARQLSGDLARKARHFFEGLHWWRRGRFGRGPDLGGLAKSAAAVETPGGLVWLYMPAEPPLPDPERESRDVAVESGTGSAGASGGNLPISFQGPSDRTRVQTPQPPVERRHHYTWAWEDRRIIPTSSGGSGDQTTNVSGIRAPLSTFW